MQLRQTGAIVLLGLGASMVAPAALADPGYYVVSVYESEGVARADFRYWTVKLKGSSTVIWPEIAVGYGVNKRWYTQVLASYIGSADSATRPSNLQWQNDFLLTQGQFDVDLALHTLLVRYYDNGGNALEFGPAMQTEWGRMRFNANLILERPWGLARPSSSTSGRQSIAGAPNSSSDCRASGNSASGTTGPPPRAAPSGSAR